MNSVEAGCRPERELADASTRSRDLRQVSGLTPDAWCPCRYYEVTENSFLRQRRLPLKTEETEAGKAKRERALPSQQVEGRKLCWSQKLRRSSQEAEAKDDPGYWGHSR
ncbi:Alstrom Syndrome Protein 1 [Manis pentadactyla]|nr:Alstrom Syndrome Protein 1 [Manis pentadactyla]